MKNPQENDKRMKQHAYTTKVAKAGYKAPPTALKTYIPAAVVRELGLENGDILEWRLRRGKLTVKVKRQSKVGV